MPSSIIYGGGSRLKLGEVATELGASRALIVTDPGVVKLGIVGEIESILAGAGLTVRVFDDVQPDPTGANVTTGVAELKAHYADLVVAVGGGSPIETAKVIAI